MRASHLVILLIVAATAVAVLPPRGCAGPQSTLLMTVWGMPFEDRLFLDGYARGFERLHPGVRVQYERYADVIPKYEAWHTIGRGADVMRTSLDRYPAQVAKGMLAPLDEFINDPEIGLSPAEQADFFPALWRTLEIDGQRYALPSDNAQYGLYYNKQLFDRYNAAHPEQPLAYPSAEWTWEDLRRAADLLTVRDAAGQTVQYGISFDQWAWPFLAFLKQAGGELWDAEQTTTLINSDAGVEALEFLESLIPKDAPFRALDMADTASGPHALFKSGKLAMMLDGSWRAPNVELDNAALDFAVAPLPHHRRAAVTSGSVLWAISSHSRNKRLAWQMVKWLVSREQSLRYWDTLRVAPPALLSVVNSPEFEETHGVVEEVDGRRRVLVPPMPHDKFADRAAWLRYAITPDPQTGEMPGFLAAAPYEADLEQKIGRVLVETVRGEKTARQALDDAVRDMHALIDHDRATRGLPAVPRPCRP
jgi:multiple sugar transport system substrate-binding protein